MNIWRDNATIAKTFYTIINWISVLLNKIFTRNTHFESPEQKIEKDTPTKAARELHGCFALQKGIVNNANEAFGEIK